MLFVLPVGQLVRSTSRSLLCTSMKPRAANWVLFSEAPF